MKEKNTLQNDLSIYKAVRSGQVEFKDVDAFAVVHNVRYLFWLEAARTDYFEKLGMKPSIGFFLNEYPFMVVRNEVDYYRPMTYPDKYKVLSRIEFMKNSSIGFEQIIINDDGEIVLRGRNVMVHMDLKNKESRRLPENLRDLIRDYETEEMLEEKGEL